MAYVIYPCQWSTCCGTVTRIGVGLSHVYRCGSCRRTWEIRRWPEATESSDPGTYRFVEEWNRIS